MKIIKNLFFLLVLFSLSACDALPIQGTKKASTPADGGVYRSDDNGETFEQKVKIDEQSNLSNEDILSLLFDPQDTRIIYAGTVNMGLLRSKDKGETWEKSKGEFTNVTNIFVSHTNHDVILITARVEGVTKLLRTTDGGENWEEVFRERTATETITAFAVNKDNEKIIYLGDARGGIYKTTDGGVTWKNLLWAKSGISQIVGDSVNSKKYYFVTVSSGVFRSYDEGETFESTELKSSVLNFVVHPTKEGVVFASANEGLGRSDDGGMTWDMFDTLIRSEEIGSRGLAVDPKNDNIIYFVSGKSLYKSVNGGQTWKAINLPLSRWVILMKVDPVEPNTVYFGTKKPPEPKKNSLFF